MIGLFVVSSSVGKQREIGKKLKRKISQVLKKEKVKVFELLTTEKEVKVLKNLKDKISGCIILVATGGTQRVIKEIVNNLKKPTLIWANPFNNSLASSLEAYSKLKDSKVKLVYYPTIKKFPEIISFIKICETIQKLKESKIGCIGHPSKWKLTQKNKKAIKRLGPKVVEISIKDLVKIMDKIKTKEVDKVLKKIKFGKIKVSEKDLKKALRVYLAMKKLVLKYGLSAITIKCFDLLDYNCTACLGISFCNDEGITAGCEADLQATLTMLIVSLLTSKPCWMANVARIDKKKNTVTLVHCTIASKMISNLSNSTLLSHMESGKFVAIRGPLKKTEVTLVRLGGNLNKMLIAEGRIIRNTNDPNLCRTQVEVKLKGRVEDFLSNSLGNHHILAYGKLKEVLKDFCKFKGIKAIVIDD